MKRLEFEWYRTVVRPVEEMLALFLQVTMELVLCIFSRDEKETRWLKYSEVCVNNLSIVCTVSLIHSSSCTKGLQCLDTLSVKKCICESELWCTCTSDPC